MKQKWYRSNATKAVWIALEHIFAVTAVISVLWMLAYPAVREEIFEGKPARKYEDSRNFETVMQDCTSKVAAGIGTRELFETEGRYNPDKLVDIQEYNDSTTISGKDTSGVCYRLEELRAWSAEGIYDEEADREENIIVCKKRDGSYHYYKMSEFVSTIESGKLRFLLSESGDMSTSEILYELQHGSDGSYDELTERGLQDEKGELVYMDSWCYDGYKVKEFRKPVGADSLLDVVNSNPNWNGRLNEAYDMVANTIFSIEEMYGQYRFLAEDMAEGDTNYSFIYADTKTGEVYTNRKAYEDYARLETSLEAIRKTGKYVIVLPKLQQFETNLADLDATAWRDNVKYNGGRDSDFLFAAAVDTTYPIQDSFYAENSLYSKYGASARFVAVFGVLAVLLFIVGFVWLIGIAGRSAHDEELHLCRFDHWKTEIAAACVIAVWVLPMFFGIYGTNIVSEMANMQNYADQTRNQYTTYSQMAYVGNSIPYIMVAAVMAAYTCGMFLIGVLSLTRRIKARTLWKNSVLRCIVRFLKHFFDHLHCVWKLVVLFGIFTVIHWFAYITYPSAIPLMLMLLAELGAFVYLSYTAIGKDKLKKGLGKIYEGDVEYEIPLQGLDREQREIAEMINSIGEGLDAALAKSMKSERLKTDLITNVSHDIKTPLTSIINYVNLLKQEEFEDPKIQHYIEVLEQKAQRLKTLTEDVVEASKVSSGNITLEYMNINLVEMIQQTSGEFEEKFAARDLREVMSLPDEEALIRVDGRRTWRILENIYNNAAKYAMKGSRIYADLKVEDKAVVFSLKNVSEQPLNISADELTERFIRGDISRSTEGSGLGLSIAKTLTEMQGGKFELYLDGDLFKATITFPRADGCGSESEL